MVPWVDLPYRPPVGTTAGTEPVDKPRWCTVKDVHLGALSGEDAGGGWRYFSFPLTVTAGAQCSLQGYPVIHLAGPARSWSATSVPMSDFAVAPGEIVDFAHRAVLDFRWSVTDDAGYGTNTENGTIAVTVDLPHAGGTLTSTMTLHGEVRPGQPERVGRLLAEPLSAKSGVVYGGLYQTGLDGTVRVTTTSLTAGAPFDYRVWVAGQQRATALLPGCVGYRERLVAVTTGITLAAEDHELNCAAVASLPPSGRLFSMQIHVPATIAYGTQVELEWEPDAQGPYPTGLTSSPTLTVT